MKTPQSVDHRLIPLRNFAYETFFEARGVHLILTGAALKTLKVTLERTQHLPEYDLEALKMAWLQFLHSKDKFHRSQGDPLRFWAANVVAFIQPRTVDVAKAWLRGRLEK